MSETQWPHFLSPFCSFSSFSCLKAPLREMRAKTFNPSSLLWSLILAVFLPEKMRCATRLINCWNFLFYYQSWLHHVLFVLSPALSAISLLSITTSLCLSTWTLSSLFSLLLPSFMSLSSGKSITRVPPSHLYLLPNPSSFLSLPEQNQLFWRDN